MIAVASFCVVLNAGTTVRCSAASFGLGSITLDVIVDIADDAPCSVVNTVTFTALNANTASDSDPTPISGGDCNGGDGDGGGSILPINLSGIIPVFNNINSTGAANSSNQVFGLNAP